MAFPQLKPVLCFADVSKTAGATATGIIDTLDTTTGIRYDFLCLALKEATADVVSNKPTVLKFTEDDTSNITSASAIVALTGGTATSATVGFTIAAANTSATTLTVFNIDLRGRKRYLFLSVSPATTQVNGAWGVLGRGSQAPSTATLGSIKQLIEG